MAPKGRKISMEVRTTPQTPHSLLMPTHGESSLKKENSNKKASQ